MSSNAWRDHYRTSQSHTSTPGSQRYDVDRSNVRTFRRPFQAQSIKLGDEALVSLCLRVCDGGGRLCVSATPRLCVKNTCRNNSPGRLPSWRDPIWVNLRDMRFLRHAASSIRSIGHSSDKPGSCRFALLNSYPTHPVLNGQMGEMKIENSESRIVHRSTWVMISTEAVADPEDRRRLSARIGNAQRSPDIKNQ